MEAAVQKAISAKLLTNPVATGSVRTKDPVLKRSAQSPVKDRRVATKESRDQRIRMKRSMRINVIPKGSEGQSQKGVSADNGI